MSQDRPVIPPEVSEELTEKAEALTEVAGKVGEQAGALAADAGQQVRDLFGETKRQLRDVAVQERDRLGVVLDEFTRELEVMRRSGTGGYASQLTDMLLSKARTLKSSVATSDPDTMVHGVQRYARQKPGTFIGGAVVLGFVVGRMARAATSSSSAATSSREQVDDLDLRNEEIAVVPLDFPASASSEWVSRS
jgi:ElaB/YqjD/DUF883 family membrane-anchored ribosome-binding protein